MNNQSLTFAAAELAPGATATLRIDLKDIFRAHSLELGPTCAPGLVVRSLALANQPLLSAPSPLTLAVDEPEFGSLPGDRFVEASSDPVPLQRMVGQSGMSYFLMVENRTEQLLLVEARLVGEGLTPRLLRMRELELELESLRNEELAMQLREEADQLDDTARRRRLLRHAARLDLDPNDTVAQRMQHVRDGIGKR